jgi:hypothetical protein
MFSRLRRSISRTIGSPHKYTSISDINNMSDEEFSKMKVKDIQCKHIMRNIDQIIINRRKLVTKLCQYKSRNPTQRHTSIKIFQNKENQKSNQSISQLRRNASQTAIETELEGRLSALLQNNASSRKERSHTRRKDAMIKHAKIMKKIEEKYSPNSKTNKS